MRVELTCDADSVSVVGFFPPQYESSGSVAFVCGFADFELAGPALACFLGFADFELAWLTLPGLLVAPGSAT